LKFILVLSFILIIHPTIGCAEPSFLTKIPTECSKVRNVLDAIKLPSGFHISPNEAHRLTMKKSGIIKPCASKLEQVIYVDSEFYYFTNSVLLLGKQSFTDKAVKVNGTTGKTTSGF